METFTQAELLLINKSLFLLKQRGPGWPVISQDEFMSWNCTIDVLRKKVTDQFQSANEAASTHRQYERNHRTSSDLLLASIPFRGRP